MKKLTLGGLLALTAAPAAAAVITPVGVTATSTLNTGFYSPNNLINSRA